MTPDIEALNRLATAWMGLAWAVVGNRHCWSGSSYCRSGTRRSSPSLRYWFWQIAAIKLMVMPSRSRLDPPARDSTPRDRVMGLVAGCAIRRWDRLEAGGSAALRAEDAAADGLPDEGQAADRGESNGKPGCSWLGGSRS